jgi:hypothetical protein
MDVTTPAASNPKISGSGAGGGKAPARIGISEKLTPMASARIRT